MLHVSRFTALVTVAAFLSGCSMIFAPEPIPDKWVLEAQSIDEVCEPQLWPVVGDAWVAGGIGGEMIFDPPPNASAVGVTLLSLGALGLGYSAYQGWSDRVDCLDARAAWIANVREARRQSEERIKALPAPAPPASVPSSKISAATTKEPPEAPLTGAPTSLAKPKPQTFPSEPTDSPAANSAPAMAETVENPPAFTAPGSNATPTVARDVDPAESASAPSTSHDIEPTRLPIATSKAENQSGPRVPTKMATPPSVETSDYRFSLSATNPWLSFCLSGFCYRSNPGLGVQASASRHVTGLAFVELGAGSAWTDSVYLRQGDAAYGPFSAQYRLRSATGGISIRPDPWNIRLYGGYADLSNLSRPREPLSTGLVLGFGASVALLQTRVLNLGLGLLNETASLDYRGSDLQLDLVHRTVLLELSTP